MKMKIAALVAIFAINTISAQHDYITELFPEDSLIRQVHVTEPYGAGPCGFDSRIRYSCDYINRLLEEEATWLPASAYMNSIERALYNLLPGAPSEDVVDDNLESLRVYARTRTIEDLAAQILSASSQEALLSREVSVVWDAVTRIRNARLSSN